ncbi:uncharacterized protein LOC119736831 [Patiria miniata]|uniref:Apple domain-containing protein n=1 Tax=Patiria miniata TaxID=46514 RepID=A0A914ATG0_PATMI|nr:uncharacterized protein LOC119736831 [Patiria miniata]
MRVLIGSHVSLIAVICSSEIFLANGSAPVTASGTFHLAKHGEYQAVPQRVIASSVGRSKPRCFTECLKKEICRQVCYEKTSGQCVLEDATLVPVNERATMPGAAGCTYYAKEVCSTTYQLSPYQRKFPLPAFDGDEVVLDFAVKARNAAMVLFSNDGSGELPGLVYELVFGVGSRTIIRRCLTCNVLKGVPSTGDISETEFRRFWLHYDRGTFKLGKYQEQAYLQWTTTPPNPTRFIGFGAYGRAQTWVVYHTCQ